MFGYRQNVESIKKVLPYNVGIIEKTGLVWNRGNLNYITGEVISSTKSIYSNMFSILENEKENVQITVKSGYRVDVHYRDSDGNPQGNTKWMLSDGSVIKLTVPYPFIKIVINHPDLDTSPQSIGEYEFVLNIKSKITLKDLSYMPKTINDIDERVSALFKKKYTLNDFVPNKIYSISSLNIGDTAPSVLSNSAVGNSGLKISVNAGDMLKVKGSTYEAASKFMAIVDTNYKVLKLINSPVDVFTDIQIDVDGYALINVHSDYDNAIIHVGYLLNKELYKYINDIYETPIYAPSPQLPANTDANSDFDADACTTQDIYNYLDELIVKYPNYLSKEVLGKDESGTLDVNRYVAHKKYYMAWMKKNYSQMYAWGDGVNIFYFTSCSPRIGDKAYSTPYIGEYQYTVSAVNNANREITVNGLTLTRKHGENVKPTLVYTTVLATSEGDNIVNDVGSYLGITIATISETEMVDSNGVTYQRYPLGDLERYRKTPFTIVLWGNEHGPDSDPRECAIVLSRMIKDLCESNHKTNKFLNFIKNYCKLIVIPVANPYGFDQQTDGRNNYNGVNINRNYDCPGWAIQPDTTKGAYGGSEIETQYIMNTLKESEAKVGVDIHCLGASYGNCHYGGQVDSRKVQKIVEVMKNDYNLNCTSHALTLPTEGARGNSYLYQEGIFGGLLEMQTKESEIVGDLHSSLIMEANYTFLLETLYMWITDYNSDISIDKII